MQKLKNFGFWFAVLIFEFCILNYLVYIKPLAIACLCVKARRQAGLIINRMFG